MHGMKAKTLGALIGALVLLGATLGAQETEDSTVFPVTVPVLQVYQHQLGYWAVYQKSDLTPGQAFLPFAWFNEATGQGEVQFVNHRSAPYMTVFYRDGEFSHVRLVVPSNRQSRAWRAVPSGLDLTQEFNIDTLELEF